MLLYSKTNYTNLKQETQGSGDSAGYEALKQTELRNTILKVSIDNIQRISDGNHKIRKGVL